MRLLILSLLASIAYGQAPCGINGVSNNLCTFVLSGDVAGSNSATKLYSIGPSIIVNDTVALQTTICALPSPAGGTVIVNKNITLTADINNCSLNYVHVWKMGGVVISAAGHTILNDVPINNGEEHYTYTNYTVACSDCSGGSRPYGQPFVFYGQGNSGMPTPIQTDANVLMVRYNDDSFGPISVIARTNLSVRTSMNGDGTYWGILSDMILQSQSSNKGSVGVASYLTTNTGALSSASGSAALFGECDLAGSMSCSGLAVETKTLSAAATTIYGIIVNQQPSTGNLHTNYGVANYYEYPNPTLSLTDIVANGTSTITSATSAFTTGMVGSYISIQSRGVYKIASFTNSSTITLAATYLHPGFNTPATGTGLVGVVGVNPGFGIWSASAGGHHVGGFLLQDRPGQESHNDFFNAQFATSYDTNNIIQFVNNPQPTTTNTGHPNILEFWRGALGTAYTTPMIENLTGKLTGKIISDITNSGSYAESYVDIWARVGDALTKIGRFDGIGLSLDSGYRIKMVPTVVGSLGICGAGQDGMHWAVTDALAPSFLVSVVGGGSIHSPVYCNGSNWVAY